MNQQEIARAHRAMELRRAFDHGFAEAPSSDRVPTEAFLAISAASGSYALRLSEISGLYVDKKITPLPSASAALIGLASFRGALVPIYNLRVLLGHSPTSMPRWLVLMASQKPVGLAFDHFDGYLDLPREAVIQEQRSEIAKPFGHEIARVADSVRPIIRLLSVLEAITNRASQPALHKE